MRAKTDRAAVKMGQSKLPVVVDCKHILEADFTAAKVRDYHFIIFITIMT